MPYQQVVPTDEEGVAPWSEPERPDRPDERPVADPDVPGPIGLVFPSRHGGLPHVVIVLDMGVVVCTCPAMRSIESRPAGCWAMKEARRIIGVA